VRRFVWAVVVSLFAGCCGPAHATDPAFTAVTPPKEHISIQGQAGYILSLAWLKGGTVIVGYTKSLGPPVAAQIWQLRVDGTGFRSVPLPRDSHCTGGWDDAPSALADGRLAVTRVCQSPSSRGGIFSVVGYDLTTGRAEDLVVPQEQVNPSSTSWNPAVDTAIASVSSSICAHIFWLKHGGPQPLNVTISEGGKTWRVDEEAPTANGGCDPDGRADLPAWSPDGGTIAFLGSPQSIGVKGQARLEMPWNVYLLNPVDLKLRKVLTDIKGPSELAWSPDSQSLAFSGAMDNSGGLWLYRVTTGKLLRIDTDQPALVAWSPDGQKLAAITSVGREPDKGQYVLYSVAQVLN